MPIGYLIPALLVLLSLYFVGAPPAWPRPFQFWWVVAAVFNELPFLVLLALAANTTLAFYQGDIVSLGGWITVGFNVAAAAGLVVMARWSLEAAPALNRALAAELGDEWTARLDRPLVNRLRQGPRPQALLGPFLRRTPGVRHVRNVAYGEAGRAHTLDIYHHPRQPAGCPTFIHLHSGALRTGKKDNDALPMLYHLAQQGWVCLSANYRLQPQASFVEQVADIRRVVAWTRAHAGDYGGDPGFIILGGGSSGGHLAALVGLEPGAVQAVVALYGQFYYGPVAESPTAHVTAAAPPFLLVHGDHDNLVPVEGTRQLARKLRSMSRHPVVYAELPHAEHNFDLFNSVRSLAVANAVQAFGEWVQANRP